VKFVDMFV